MNNLVVSIKRLHADAWLPVFAHPTDAGADLHSIENATLQPGERAVIATGIALALPDGYAAFVQPRSGLAAKNGISMVNTPGTVDAGYRGELKVILINHDLCEAFTVQKGDRIAQLVVQKIEQPAFQEVDELSDADRGDNGFGSTGVGAKR
jgi:dUTP pyrophosphatase